MRFGLSDLEELPSLKEFEALAREALGSDEGVAPSSESFREGDVAGSAPEEHKHESAAAAMAHVEVELAEAEAVREHEAMATAEGMPSGQLDEDPPPPVVKSTAAGE
jgi:hypothetical protein